jgi:hypothetical protein
MHGSEGGEEKVFPTPIIRVTALAYLVWTTASAAPSGDVHDAYDLPLKITDEI